MIGIISGSQRLDSESLRIAKIIGERLNLKSKDSQSYFIYDLALQALPFWQEAAQRQEAEVKQLADLSKKLQSCSAFVFITPEWGGMATPAIKNFFLHCERGELAHKPALLVSVSSGPGGSYPIAELRSFGFKNTKVCFIPDHLIVRQVEQLFQIDQGKNDVSASAYFQRRIDYSLDVLLLYAAALETVRLNPALKSSEFRFGM